MAMSQLQNTTFVNISSNGYHTDRLIGLLEECLRHNWTVRGMFTALLSTRLMHVSSLFLLIKITLFFFSTLEQISLTRAMVKDGHDHIKVFLSLKRKNS